MHAASLIRIRPTSYHEYSPSQLVLGTQPNISHLRILIEMNFTDSNGMDLSYFDNDFLIGPSENFDYLIDDVNDNVK